MTEPVKPGYIRLYEDQTGRWYADITESEYEEMCKAYENDPLVQILKEEITKELDKEVVRDCNGSR